MELNSNSIGALLIFMGLGIMFYLWIGVISPNRDTQNIWSLVTTIFWI